MNQCEVCNNEFTPSGDEKICPNCSSNNNVIRDTMTQPSNGLTFTDVLIMSSVWDSCNHNSHPKSSAPVITEQPQSGDGASIGSVGNDEVSVGGSINNDECGDDCCGDCDCNDCTCIIS